jgi:two-component system response regulator AtoC
MKQLLDAVSTVAASAAAIFISGESGTGKEVIAQAIHTASPRSERPFIKVNCAAIPATLLESEFFGHERGAFTGALQRKLGRFERAHTGTLLLDEVSEIPLELQAKLLRAVQEREFERVGGVTPVRVDVRLIATSNRQMKEAIEQKLFREDLYYRLNVIPLQLPPLRERREDIPPLALYFLQRFCEQNRCPLKLLRPSALNKLLVYHWPGNIRELANVIERSVIMNPETALEAHQIYLDLSCPLSEAPTQALPLGITLDELERRFILQTLERQQGNRTHTARTLGISLRTLRNKLNLYR